MTERHLATLFTFALLATTACGDPPPVTPTDGGHVDAGPPECPSGTSMCGDTCVDTQSSRESCGACGNACAAGEACVDGDCSVVCPSGQSECSGLCADTQTDARHCGACGTECASGEACVAGSCEVSCPSGQSVCGASCVDTGSDPAHCGACGTVCDAGEVCSAGACATSCGAGVTECSGACVDTQTNPAHCGACGTACAEPSGATGVCMAGTCRAVCDALMGDCNADRTSSTGDGCETPLATDPANCGACGRVCALAGAVSGCDAGACVITTCDAGFADCDTTASTGCEAELATDAANCGACGNACAAGEACFAGMCVVEGGEDCSDALVLSPGSNTLYWSATTADYLTTSPSCSSQALAGPDVVFSYTATVDERVTLAIEKPASQRWSAVVSTGACGTLTPETACMSDFTPTEISSSFILTAGQTAYVYLSDTTSGTMPLTNPLEVDVTAVDCTTVPPVTLDPPTGSTADRLSLRFTATFGAPMISTTGTVTVTGTMGTSLTYNLATATEVSFDASNTVMTIDPGISFPPGEVLTISWTGLLAVVCTTPVAVPAPTWQVTAPTPPCAPGVGGVVGSTLARLPTGLTASFTEYFVAADESPTGWVYFGGTGDLYRLPKAGGTIQNVETIASLTTSHLGYAMVISGQNIFLIESTTSGTTGHIIRISSDGGTTWMTQAYATFPMTPGDDFRGATVYGGRIYLVTDESTDADATEIWSVDANAATVPAAATLERTFFVENDCNGIVRDSTYYYVSCGTGDRLVRVPVTGTAPAELITTFFDLNLTTGAVHGDDVNADGVLDVLYVQGGLEEVGYVCGPATATPFVDRLASFGTGTSNFGLGFDSTANVLWMIDDDTRELVSVQ